MELEKDLGISSKAFTTRIIVLNHEHKVLLQQKAFSSKNAGGKWELPGGKIKYNEEEKKIRLKQGLSIERNSREAVIDELLEEKNIDLREFLESHPNALRYIGEFEFEFYDSTVRQTLVRVEDLYLIIAPDHILTTVSKHGLEEDNLIDFGWFTVNQIKDFEDRVSENSQFYKLYNIDEYI